MSDGADVQMWLCSFKFGLAHDLIPSGSLTPKSRARTSLGFARVARGQFFKNVLRHRFVNRELHRIVGATLGDRTYLGRVTKHRRERHARSDNLSAGAIFHLLD